jgi:hypothetical protein
MIDAVKENLLNAFKLRNEVQLIHPLSGPKNNIIICTLKVQNQSINQSIISPYHIIINNHQSINQSINQTQK